MEDMARRWADRAVRSVFLYTREAHPGEDYRHHTSMGDKRHHARAFQHHNRIERSILLDDLDGSAHRAYGMLPNMSWIIGRGGVVYYKAAWTDVTDLESALAATVDGLERRSGEPPLAPFYTERLSWRVRDMETFRRQLAIAGPQAVRDFFAGDEGDDDDA
jgi:hypothetical protein